MSKFVLVLMLSFFLLFSACGGNISLIEPIGNSEGGNITSKDSKREVVVANLSNPKCSYQIEQVAYKSPNFRFLKIRDLENFTVLSGSSKYVQTQDRIFPYDYLVTGHFNKSGSKIPYEFVWNGEDDLDIPPNQNCQEAKTIKLYLE